MNIIPVIDANDSLLEAELDGRTFFLNMSWNSEAALWTLSIENADNELVVASILLAPNVPLLAPYRHLSVPAGEIVAVLENDQDNIGRTDFVSGLAKLIYVSVDDAL
jgi:hypothetical protein